MQPVRLAKLLLISTIAVLLSGLLTLHAPVTGAQETPDQMLPQLMLYIVVDESDSMWGWNDPEARRVAAVETLIDALGADTLAVNGNGKTAAELTTDEEVLGALRGLSGDSASGG